MSKSAAKLAYDLIPAKNKRLHNMLVMHGLFGNKMNFRSLAKRLEMSENSDVYLLDLRNQGDSEHKPSMKIEDISTDIESF